MATTDIWSGTGNWTNNGSLWNEGRPPLSTENAEIQTGTDNLTSAAAIVALQVDAPAILQLTSGATLTATGTAAVAGEFLLQSGGSASVSGALSITGNAVVWVDSPFNNGLGGSSLTIGGTLTNSSSNSNALYIGASNITTGDTVTAGGLVNTGNIQIAGNGTTIESTLDITSGAAGFGTLGVETGLVSLSYDALLEFASGQIGTIDGIVGLYSANARIADAGTLATNSALAGLNTVAGEFQLAAGATVVTTGGLSITGNGVVWLDSPFNNGFGGSSLTIGGTLTNSSSNSNALYIGASNITTGDTVTATGLVNTGAIQIVGNGTTVESTLDITSGAAGFGTLGVETGSVGLSYDALLEFASGQIGTIDGIVGLYTANGRIADAGTLATNSALAGLNTVAGEFQLAGGATVVTTGGLSITGNGVVWLDSPFNNGFGGSSLTIGGTLTNSSSNSNALYIGASNITTGDTVTAHALVNTGDIQIVGNGTTVESTLDITSGAAGFGTLGVETGSVSLSYDALLEFASGQIGTIDGTVALYSANARIADASTLATNSALTGLNTVAGELELGAGATVSTTGGLSITGNGVVFVDAPFFNGFGGSSLTVGGTLTDSSSNGNALYIGTSNITTGDTVMAHALVNTGDIQIVGNGTTVESTLDITSGAAGFGTLGVETGSVSLSYDALLEFASGQIGTIDGTVALYSANARIADASTLATNSALTGLNTVAGELELGAGATVSTTGGLSITGNGVVYLDSPFFNGFGGSSLTVGGTLTDSSTNNNALYIGTTTITTGDTVTAHALVNTGVIAISGNGTIQSTLDITTGAAGFGTVGVETGLVQLTNDALLEFASGQIGTIDGTVLLNGANARIADASTLATNSALTGLNTVDGEFELSSGASVSTTGGLSITGNGLVLVDSPFNNGGGGSSLTIGGTLTDSSTNNNALYIGNTNITTGDTVTAHALVNTGVIAISGNGTIQSTLDITTGAAGFGTVGVETGLVQLTNDALLEFASGQIGTIDGTVLLNNANERFADAGTLATNSALTGLNTVAGAFELAGGAAVVTTGGLSITGNGVVWVDSPFDNGGGGSSLTVGGTLTDSSSNGNALYIGASNITIGDTVTAAGLVNSGVIQIVGNGTIATAALDINGPATNTGAVDIDASGEVVMGAGDAYTQAGDATNIAAGGTLAGTVDVTGGSLDGTGTVAGTVNDTSGTVFGGPSIGTPGTLTVNGTYNQSGTGNLEANIGSGGTSSGVVTVSAGNYVNLSGGTLSVSGTPAVGTLLTVMTFGAGHLIGQFAAVQDGSEIGDGSFVNLGDGTSLEVFYNNDNGNIQIEHVNNSSLATSYAWIDGTANWATAADWSGGQVPNSTANVVIGNTTTGNVTLNGSSGDTTVNSLSIQASNTLTVSAVTLTSGTSGGNITVASGGTLSLTGSGEIDGSVLTGAGLYQAIGGTGILAGDTISAGTSFIGQNGATTELLGAIDNAGSLDQIGGSGTSGTVLIGNNVTLAGGGTVTLDTVSGGGNAILEGNSATLTNTNNTIQGTGTIGDGSLALVNSGVVDATPEGGTATLTLNGSGGVTNTNLLEATGGGTLTIATAVTNTGANIIASGSGSVLDISNGATVTGGTLTATGGGVMETAAGSSAALQAVTIAAGSTYTATDNATTTLLGTINNLGSVQLDGGAGENGILAIGNSVTLTGHGTVTLSDATGAGGVFIDGNSETLTNSNNTIQGTGTIGNGSLAFINASVVDAKPEGGTATLTLNGSGGVTNTDLLEATAGGTLMIATNVTNTGGTITASGSLGVVDITGGATIAGGTLNTASAGVLETATGSSAVLQGVTIGSGSTYTATDNSTTTLLGTIDNAGTIEQAGGNGQSGFLAIGNSASLTGGGTVLLDDVSGSGSAYISGNGETLTNTNNKIEGTGVIGNGSLALINGGVIDATPEGGTSTLTVNGTGGFSSTGTLEATDGATLALNAGSVTASGLVLIAAGSTLSLSGQLTLNGTLNNAGTITGGGEVVFGSGTNRLIVAPGATSSDTVVGGGVNSTIELTKGTGAGTLDALGTTYTNFGTVIVDSGGTWTVDALASALASTTITGDGALSTLALISAGTFSLGEVSDVDTIDLAAGNSSVTVADKTLSVGSVTINDGASGNNSVSTATDTSASKGKTLTYNAGTGTDSFSGGFENDKVNVTAAAVGGDTLTGGSGGNTLTLTSAGSANLSGVSKFATIDLAAGGNAVTVTDNTLSIGSVTIKDGASGNNSINAATDTSASKGKTLTYDPGTGTDSFTGGFENDKVNVTAAAVGGDTLTGGSGGNTLTLTSAGSANLGGVSKFATIQLAAGGNAVTVTDTTLSGGSATIKPGTSGNNSVSAAGDTSASKGKTLTYTAGTGTDSFTGGFENDKVNVTAAEVGGDTLTGGSGSNTLTLTSAGTVNLGGVSKFATIDQAAGNNVVTVTDTTLSGGAVTIKAGASGNNTVSASGDTSASKGKTLTYDAGSGTDSFTGGFETDKVSVTAAAVGGDTLTGGSASNTLTLTSAGTVNLGGVSKFATIDLAAGNNVVTVTDTTLSGGAVTIKAGASGNNTVSATGDTSASTGKTLTYDAGSGTDSFTGGFETDKVSVTAAAVGGDTLTGGSASNTLTLTSAGSANLGGVSKFATIDLATGGNAVTVTDTTLSSGAVTIKAGASGNNTVSAAGDTSASTGKTLTYVAGTGTDHFTGGFETDKVSVSAAAVGGDVLTGGSGANTLTLTTAGTAGLGGVSKFGTVDLAAGNNTLTVTDTTLSGGAVTIKAGATGNETISAAGDTSASEGTSLTYYSGSGADSFTGGFENDTIYAGTGLGTYTAGSGNDTFVFIKSSLPTQTLDNFFQLSSDDILVYGTHSSGGFNLGTTDNGLNPTTPTAIDASIFVKNATGSFTLSTQRFAYDTSTGQLFYSATGSNSSESTVATLTGAPAITASNLLFEH